LKLLSHSPINDLLDKGSYTLEELLNEDELIQEVKAKNDRLIEL
jgi:serine/threonine-protein phosphatase 6 regulatory subunit 3